MKAPTDGIDYGYAPASLRPAGPPRPVEVGGVALVELAPLDAAPLPPVGMVFSRPAWQLASIGTTCGAASLGMVGAMAVDPIGTAAVLAAIAGSFSWAAVRRAAFRVRARWDAHAFAVESWPMRLGARAERAALVDVFVDDAHAIVRTSDGRGLPLVVGRRALTGDRERACALAVALGLPLVDATGTMMALPGASVVRGP